MKKRMISFSMALMMVLSLAVSINTVQAEAAPHPAMPSNMPVAQTNGFIAPIDHTVPSDAVFIKSASDLAAIPGGSAGSGRYYVLANDIHLTAEWVPIEDFRGTLDGQGHTISNLFVLSGSNRHNAGLFATATASAVIKNLGVNISVLGISSGTEHNVVNVGGLIGDSGGSIIINCYVIGTIHGTSNAGLFVVDASARVGGLVGNSEGSAITGSYALGSVNATVSAWTSTRHEGPSAGGLIGSGIGVTITNSFQRTAFPQR